MLPHLLPDPPRRRLLLKIPGSPLTWQDSSPDHDGAIELGAARVGHGIAMGGRKDIIDVCRRHRTGIEMCPVSNLQTHAVDSWEQYPIREFLEEGLLVTLNTDNRTVSGTTLSREMEEVQKHCGIPLEEFYRIERNAVEVAFADDSVKHELWKMMRA
mgnify:CR=1 FL=1